MSHSDEITPKKKSRTQTSVAVWLLMAMLVAGLGGFGVTNFGRSVATLGYVGTQEITVNQYARALRNQINALSQQFGQQLTLKEAQLFGIDSQVLQNLISDAALDNEATRIGLSVGNATVAEKVAAVKGFQDINGAFSRQVYGDVLKQNNLTIKEFETSIRQETARQLLQAAVVGGFEAPAALTDTLWAYAGEKRGFSVLRLTEAGLPTPIPAPTDAELKSYYDANIATFTRPEGKKITYVSLQPADILPTIAVDEAAVQKLYDERKAQYVIPEKRLVERLVFPDDAAAAAAKAKLDAGATFESVVKERGVELADIDLGDVSKPDLGPAGDAIFALTAPGVAGPLPSDLGPALYRMNAILAAQETTLAQAHDDLAKEIRMEAARKSIADKVEAVDDLLAGGSTLEEVAKDQGLTLATTDYAKGADDNAALLADPAFADAADKVEDGDYPEVISIEDGGIAALRFDAAVPATPIPFDKARDKLAAAWRADTLAAALKAQGEAARKAVEAGASLASQGVTDIVQPQTRDVGPEGMPPEVVKAAFEMKPGELRLIALPGFVALVRLDSVQPAETGGDAAKSARDKIAVQSRQGLAQDAYGLYIQAMTTQGGLSIDQSAIAAVQAQMN